MRHGGRPPVAWHCQRGAALIAAVLIAAIIAALAVALTARDQYAILGVSRLQEQAIAGELTRAIEVQAAAMLGQDLENSREDDEGEAWAQTEFVASHGSFEATAQLRDAQRLFNLNALAFQPPQAPAGETTGDPPGDAVPPPIDDGPDGHAAPSDDGAASRALGNVVPESSGAAPATGPDPAGDPATEDAQQLSPQQIAIARFHLLLQALQLPEEIAPAILDWLDTDSETRFPNGAEDEYYTRLEPPYRAANGPFADVSELRLVRGITPEIYEKLAPYVTVLDNAVPLNVNTAPAEVLMSLGPGLDRGTADLLVTSRQIQPWTTVSDCLRHPLLAGRPLLAQGLATRATLFELRTRIAGDDGIVYRYSLIERTAPNRLRVVRRERRYNDD